MKNGGKKMKRYRLGIIFIASIIAITSIGYGLSFWTDSISIFGTISTGDVSLELTDFSGTWVYENISNGDCIVSDTELFNDSLILVAYSKATRGNDDYDALIIFENIFPSIIFKSDVSIKYTGSIPGTISNISFDFNSSNEWIKDLIESGEIYSTIQDSSNGNISLGHILHKDDEININFYIHIPYKKELMNVSGVLYVNFKVVQWNEYKPPSGNVPPQNETPLNISGFIIDQLSSEKRFIIPENTEINPQGYLIIARDSNKTNFENFWGVSFSSNITFVDSDNTFPSINGDETFILKNKTNVTIDGPTGLSLTTYHTVERINATFDSTLESSWNISTDNYATPSWGAKGDKTAGLVINEYSDVSGSGNWRYEFIEIYYDS